MGPLYYAELAALGDLRCASRGKRALEGLKNAKNAKKESKKVPFFRKRDRFFSF
jgi:hypothetical protein